MSKQNLGEVKRRPLHRKGILLRSRSSKEWLDQGLFNINITIRQLIKSMANKEGAHSDPKYDPTLRFTKSV
ncbi:hypothetical protein CEE34_09040 [Candidatus Aerophobetes bacterium Ae_b3a]|nr:MAG: hypothetical protein CEE34_09040 [Candidatus Aerophobetes bacterium Ae_b3a]